MVVGAGLAGAATAWQLAARGHQVTLLERDVPAAHDASSHGSARIFRYAYPDPFYAHAVLDSKALWDGLAAEAGTELITPFGAVDYGPTRQPALLPASWPGPGSTTSCSPPRRPAADGRRSRSIPRSSGTQGRGHRRRNLRERHGGARGPERGPGAHRLEPGAGGRLAACTAPVTGCTPPQGKRSTPANVVISAGGWLPRLLESLPLPAGFLAGLPEFTVRQEQAFHFRYREDLAIPPATWPTFIHKAADIQAYGLPGGRDAGFAGQKVAEYNGGPLIPSAADQTGHVDPANRARVVDYVRRYLPGLDPNPTPKPPACSPIRPPRTSSSTGRTTSPSSRPAPGTAPNSPR